MADFVKGIFGAQKPVVAPVDDGGMHKSCVIRNSPSTTRDP